jgi:hypothetical protein
MESAEERARENVEIDEVSIKMQEPQLPVWVPQQRVMLATCIPVSNEWRFGISPYSLHPLPITEPKACWKFRGRWEWSCSVLHGRF